MVVEQLFVVWEYDNGIRAGFASYKKSPHYFEQIWTGYEYGPKFQLKPVSLEIVQMAREARNIFDEWERRRAQGKEDMTSRPDIPGNHFRYFKLREHIDATLRATAPLREDIRGYIALEAAGSSELQISWDEHQ